MAGQRKKSTVPPCAACEHRWGRHNGGIGACSEPGCSCASFVDEAKARQIDQRAALARQRDAAAARWARMSPAERHAETLKMIELAEATAKKTAQAWKEIEDLLRSHGVWRPGASRNDALTALGLPATATKEEVVRAFRRRAFETHPDHGGDPEDFKRLVRARDAALAALEGA